jgi:hypothetical protein
MAATPKRRWFQFSLKGMLVVMTILCVGPGGYIANERHQFRKRATAIAAIEELGGEAYIDDSRPFRPTWIRPLICDKSVGEVTGVSFVWDKVTDSGLVHLADLTKLRAEYLDHAPVTDAGLVHLAGLKKLERLGLNDTQVSDAGLVHLADLTALQALSLDFTHVTDAGLIHLSRLSELDSLTLIKTQITDTGLPHLARLTKLRELYLAGCPVTDQGVSDLKKTLPNLEIIR